jgi:hypothetical protein
MKGSAPPKVTLEDLQRQLPAEQRKIRNERMAKMKVIKDSMDDQKAIIAEKSAQGRLEYLMAQAEMFTHFSREAPKPPSAIEASAAGGGSSSAESTTIVTKKV